MPAVDAKEAEAATKEAVAAFADIRQQIMTKPVTALAEVLLDNGRPMAAEKIARQVEEYTKDIGREKEVLVLLKEEMLVPTDVQVQRLKAADGKEELVVTYRLKGTEAIGKEKFPRLPDEKTVDKDGTLKVLLKKMDGKWRWNPFGW